MENLGWSAYALMVGFQTARSIWNWAWEDCLQRRDHRWAWIAQGGLQDESRLDQRRVGNRAPDPGFEQGVDHRGLRGCVIE